MDAFVFDESDNSGDGGTNAKKEKKAKGCLVGSARKTLGDISNIQQRPRKQAIQHVNQQFDSVTMRKHVANLTMENMTLMNLLSEKNKVMESSRSEMQNLKAKFESVQQQNSQLAFANSQVLAEVTSSRDRLNILQHAVECQNVLLKVKKEEDKVKAKLVKNKKTTNEEVGIEPVESSQVVKEHCNLNTKRQPQHLALGPPIVEAVHNNGKGDCKRRLKPKTGKQLKTHLRLKMTIKGLRRQLASAKTEEPQATAESKNWNKRSLRRQSARFKIEDPAITEETKVTGDLSEINDDSLSVSLHDDVVHERESTCSLVKYEAGGKSEEHKFRRSSIRPLRRAAEKVKSY